MKRWVKILIAVVLLLVIIVAGVAIWQWENIRAAYIMLTTDATKIEENLLATRDKQQADLEKLFKITVKAPTMEQNKALISGKTTSELVKEDLGIKKELSSVSLELLDAMVEKRMASGVKNVSFGENDKSSEKAEDKVQTKVDSTKAADPTASAEEEMADKPSDAEIPTETVTADKPADVEMTTGTETTNKPAGADTPTEAETDDKKGQDASRLTEDEVNGYINLCVAELYSCEVDLMAKLGEMKTGIETEWEGTFPKNRKTKRSVIFKWMQKVYSYEAEIDGRVKNIIAKYRASLEKYGADTSGVDKLWDFYCEKKASQKAYYMNMYM